jgi:hypothetical protein
MKAFLTDVTTKGESYFAEYEQAIADSRAEFFMPFTQEDHRALCRALWTASSDLRGAYRTLKDNPMGKSYLEAFKNAQLLWLVARAAYCKKYGHMP